MQGKVLITGGSGTIGSLLTKHLLDSDYEVIHLSNSGTKTTVPSFQWDYTNGSIDETALAGVDYIIHLAGASIADGKWTKERKKMIKESRVKTAELLFEKVSAMSVKPKAFISASAIGYYGYDSGSVEKKEGSRFGDDFVATVVKEWEEAADQFAQLGIRTVKLRTGIVLTPDSGALAKMMKPVKTGFGAALGSGDQYISWIHIEDQVRMFEFAIKNEQIQGVYNSVAPQPVTNKMFTKELAKVLKKPFFMPNVPAFVLKMVLGEMASMVLGGNKVSCEKITEAGFEFKHDNLPGALSDLLD